MTYNALTQEGASRGDAAVNTAGQLGFGAIVGVAGAVAGYAVARQPGAFVGAVAIPALTDALGLTEGAGAAALSMYRSISEPPRSEIDDCSRCMSTAD